MNTEPCEPTSSSSKKSRKNPYSNTLRVINALVFTYRLENRPPDANYNDAIFKRLVLKLTPREIEKFMKLLEYMKNDPYYDTVDKILDFTPESFIERHNIQKDLIKQ